LPPRLPSHYPPPLPHSFPATTEIFQQFYFKIFASANTEISDLNITLIHENLGINLPFALAPEGKPENPREDNSDDDESNVKYFDCWFLSRV
jgi:hypothetical protein